MYYKLQDVICKKIMSKFGKKWLQACSNGCMPIGENRTTYFHFSFYAHNVLNYLSTSYGQSENLFLLDEATYLVRDR